MTDIRDLGRSGQAVFDTAQKLQKANLIDDAQFKELTNGNVGPQDVAIANQALDKVKPSTPGGMGLLFEIPRMNNNILDLQKQALQKTVSQVGQAQATQGQPNSAAPESQRLDFNQLKQLQQKMHGTSLGNALTDFMHLLDVPNASQMRNMRQ